jgi:uncharacterized phage-associated protein
VVDEDECRIMPVSSTILANTILEIGFQKRVPVDPMKLQKLMFFAHGWHLAVVGSPLASEGFDAWQYGPVNRPVYHEFKRFGANPITEYAKEQLTPEAEPASYVMNKSNKKAYDIIYGVWEKYSAFTAMQLSEMTHEEGTPWAVARSQGMSGIPDHVISKYFKNLLSGAL